MAAPHFDRRLNKMTRFRNSIALHCGVNAAVIAEYLWCLLMKEAAKDDAFHRYGTYWCRCSALMMTGELPFMSLHMVKDAIRVLKKKNIIRNGCFNEDKFDRTNWYTFTDYGVRMMGGI